MKEIEFLKFRLRGELTTRMDDRDIVDILEVLQLAEDKIENLHNENQWLYGKLNIISDVIEKVREEISKS
ncbi:hypothetical protein MZM54_05325 [[Brevibacterium] frigoritolerans]|nr:hypothetical protein [Peribacillus frigoritolerans]